MNQQEVQKDSLHDSHFKITLFLKTTSVKIYVLYVFSKFLCVFYMKKILFTAQQLNRFLLLGENNNYVIDKQYPLIRAFKRQNYLAIFCTLRIKKKNHHD